MVINRKIRKKIKRNLKHRPAKISPGQQLKQRESITIKNRNKNKVKKRKSKYRSRHKRQTKLNFVERTSS